MTQNKQSLAVGKIAERGNQTDENSVSLTVDVILALLKTNPPIQGKRILWPKVLLAKPVKVVASSGGVVTNPAETSSVEQAPLHPDSGFQTEAEQAKCSPQDPVEDEPILPSPVSDLPVSSNEDRIFNYGLQVIQLGVFLMQLDDTEREGDGERMMRNWKLLLLFNRSRRRGKKYAFEAMRLITNCRALYTPKMAHRVIHGMFVNPKGGEGNNYSNDLKQEHIVKDHKVTLHDLRGNKTLKAVTRSTSTSYSQQVIGDRIDEESNISKDSTAHTYGDCKEDVQDLVDTLHKLEPFKFTPDRSHKSFPKISKSPLDQLDPILLDTWLSKHKRKLTASAYADDDSENEDGDDDDENDVTSNDSDDEDSAEILLN